MPSNRSQHHTSPNKQIGLTERRHVVTAPNRQEAHKRNLHTRQRAQRIPGRVADVQPWTEPPHADQHKSMQRQQVGDEDVSTPRADHVSIEQRRQGTPHDTADFYRLNPEIKGEDEQEDGNRLVVVAPGHATRDVTGCNAHEDGCEETCGGRVAHLGGQEICGERGQAREGRGEEDADVSNIDWEGKHAKEVVDGARRDHEAGIERSACDTTEGVPCS